MRLQQLNKINNKYTKYQPMSINKQLQSVQAEPVITFRFTHPLPVEETMRLMSYELIFLTRINHVCVTSRNYGDSY